MNAHAADQAHPSRGAPVAAVSGSIELHLRDWNQLFESLDPSPFHEKDLDRNAEEYILGSVKELHARSPTALIIYVDQPADTTVEGQFVEDAIRVHFARRALFLRRDLKQLLRRGVISLVIGLTFLATVFLIAQLVVQLLGEGGLAALLREGLIIIGWVAMWRPLEIFLYDWWPVFGAQRMHERLSQIQVRIVYKDSHPS